MPCCLVVQHLEPEGPYELSRALASAGVAVEVRKVFAGAPLPTELEGFDGLVVMGGPMAAHLDTGFPTRKAEIELLVEALESETPVLGVCLGAQLLALAGGGRVYKGGSGPEIGWGPISLTEEAACDPLLAGIPLELDVLHWHGDTFELPPGSVHLASSARYRAQAFRCGARAWGLQFHLEVDTGAVRAFVAEFSDDIRRAGVNPESILSDSPGAIESLAPHRALVLSRFADLIAAHDREQLAELP